MKYTIIPILLLFLLLAKADALQPSLAYSVTIDTSIYEMYADVNQNPSMFFPSAISVDGTRNAINTFFPGTLYLAYRRKGTETVDIFSISGKVGSVRLPICTESVAGSAIGLQHLFSQTIVDADEGWECLRVEFGFQSVLFDDDGTQLLSDSGVACYGYDGKDTYIITRKLARSSFQKTIGYNCWRLRSDISPANAQSLSKKTATPLPMMMFGASGNFQINLQPAGGGKTSVQLFDFLGRLLYDKTIDNISVPTRLNIPERNVPKTTFAVKIKDDNRSTVRTAFPVR